MPSVKSAAPREPSWTRRPIVGMSAMVAAGQAVRSSRRGSGMCAERDFTFDRSDNHVPRISDRGVYKLVVAGSLPDQLMQLEEERASDQACGDWKLRPIFGRAKRIAASPHRRSHQPEHGRGPDASPRG